MRRYFSPLGIFLITSILSICVFFTKAQPSTSYSAACSIVYDFMANFGMASISKPIAEVSVISPTCGGVTRKAIFQHPVGPNDNPTTLTYTLSLPRINDQQHLFFVGDTGMADSIDWNRAGADGVRFLLKINGQTILDNTRTQSGSDSFCIDLGSFQNSTVKVEFITLPLESTVYDWASWGGPRIILLNNSIPVTRTGSSISIPLPSGVVTFQHEASKPLSLAFTCSDTNKTMNWSYTPSTTHPQSGMRWKSINFNFKGASDIRLQLDPDSEISSLLVNYYLYDAVLEYLTPATALINPNMYVMLRYKVFNKGFGSIPSGAAQVMVYDANEALVGHSPIPELESGESWMGDILWKAPSQIGSGYLTAKLLTNDPYARYVAKSTTVQSATYGKQKYITSFDVVLANADNHQGSRWLDNGSMRVVFNRENGGHNHGIIFSKNGDAWEQVAVWKPLARINLNTPLGPMVWEPAFTQVFRGRNADASERYTNAWQFVSQARDPMNNPWNITMTATLNNTNSALDIFYTWSTEGSPQVQSILGPNIYVGDSTFGDSKIAALFPGLEYLYGAEASSSTRDFAYEIADRRSPIAGKITIPLMAISWGNTNAPAVLNPDRFFCPDSSRDYWTDGNQPQKTIGLYWNLFQKWDGIHSFPTPRFSSPNNDEGMMNHRLALFLPSIPDYMGENQNGSYTWTVAPKQTYSLGAQVAITDGPILSAVRHYLDNNQGLPAPTPWPRSAIEERALCRAGFDTVWDGTNKWAHCVNWPYTICSGFPTLLWVDALSDPKYPRNSEAALNALTNILDSRIQPAVDNMIASNGPQSLSVPNNCHILRWEFPFHYGYLEEGWSRVDEEIKHIMVAQAPDGSWQFHPRNAQQKTLGQAGDSTMGISANNTMALLRHARITGDSASREAGLKALDFVSKFAVPRGGQVWECPMYQPDILPAAYAIAACIDAWRLTGDSTYLSQAVYWAETGIPFIYLWSYPNTPMMLGATIPVFGSTFYTHTWLAVPVQWNGLVYSYTLYHLIETLEQLQQNGQQIPNGTLHFSTADWRCIFSNILASAVQQQWPDGKLIGTYPDSISNFEKRNPAHINPEDILVNQLAMEGADPDIHSATLANTGRTISAAATISHISAASNGASFMLSYYKGCEIGRAHV